MLDHKFTSEQTQILRLLDEHAKKNHSPLKPKPFLLTDIETENKRVKILGLKNNFNKIFPPQIRDCIIKTYGIKYFAKPAYASGLLLSSQAHRSATAGTEAKE